MNKKFVLNLSMILALLGGLFYVMQNCGDNDALREKTIEKVTEDNEGDENSRIQTDEHLQAVALFEDCTGIKAEVLAETEDSLILEETQTLCAYLRGYDVKNGQTDQEFVDEN